MHALRAFYCHEQTTVYYNLIVNGRLFCGAGGVGMSKTTKEDILIVALHLFARDGFDVYDS